MRTGVVVTGVILLVLGALVAIGGSPLKGFREGCATDARCDGDDRMWAFALAALGEGLLVGGGLLAVGGIALVVVGGVAPPKPRPDAAPKAVEVQAPPTRPCPQCAAALPETARTCHACRAAVAPTLKAAP